MDMNMFFTLIVGFGFSAALVAMGIASSYDIRWLYNKIKNQF